jgi:signal transduction histidine kinase
MDRTEPPRPDRPDVGAAAAGNEASAEIVSALAAFLPAVGAVAAVVRHGDACVAAWNIDAGSAARLGGGRVEGVVAEDGRLIRAARTVEVCDGLHGEAVLVLCFPTTGKESAAPDASVQALALVVGRLLERPELVEAVRSAAGAKEHFLVALHHELRTPATAVMLEAGLLQSGMLGTLPPRIQATLTRLEQQVGDLVRVVQRVMDLAQLESVAEGRADVVDVRQAIVTLARQAERTATRKGVSLSLFFPRTLPLVQTDEERFRRVLVYLLANAVKYSGPGRVQIRVERAEPSPGAAEDPALLFRVVDSGPGIPPAELERVFEPFAQVEEGARTDSRNRGVGLGLSLARKLARSLGGDVTVESVVGSGTVATFVLPTRRAAGR